MRKNNSKYNTSILALLAGLFLLTNLTGCSAMDESADMSPVAYFTFPNHTIRAGYKVVLDASDSFSEFGTSELQYRWKYDETFENYTEWMDKPTHTIRLPFDPQENKNFPVNTSFPIELEVKTKQSELPMQVSDFIKYAYANIDDDLSFSPESTKPFTCYNFVVYDDNYWQGQNLELSSTFIEETGAIIFETSEHGDLMDWNTAMSVDVENLKIPTKEEWMHLIEFCCGSEVAGYNLQLKGNHAIQLTLGGKIETDNWIEEGEIGYYWTASESDNNKNAIVLRINKNKDTVDFIEMPKSTKLAARMKVVIPNNETK